VTRLVGQAARPTPLEIASGAVLGVVPAQLAADADGPGVAPLVALEQAILPALLRPPCILSFSGGMDSSFVLAVAANLARREGLPLPLPVTWRIPDAPLSQETPWQERVITGLGLSEWEILTAHDDLDLVGPVAQRMLLRFGSVHPVNLHLHLPIVELARGGSLLTGAGGDQILGAARFPTTVPLRTRARRRVPTQAVDLLRWHEDRNALPWLHPHWSRRRASAIRHEWGGGPRRTDHRMTWQLRRRDTLLSCAHLDALGADNGVRVVNPLIDPRFVGALARDLGASAGLTRSDVLRRISDHLPDVATAARPKATFLQVYLREPLREFVRSWSGEGVDQRFVDPDRLAKVWSTWPIPDLTGALAQQVWLARNLRTASSGNSTALPSSADGQH
jgi:hypothetical protein